MNVSHEKVIVFLPAYFAQKTLAAVYAKIPKHCVHEILLVDDASGDNVQEVAKSLGIRFFRNEQNLGYGGNLKVCLRKALELGADIMIELHPDDQYDPAAIPAALEKLKEGYDFVSGSRFLRAGAVSVHRMPRWKYAINRLSTSLARGVLRAPLSDFHCGFRVYRRRLIKSIPYLRNDNGYLFSFQLIAQASLAGFKIGEVPVTCRYSPQATQISFSKSMRYGWGAGKTLLQFLCAKTGRKYPIFEPTHAD